MSWRAAIGLAAKGMRRRPGRAVLTVLAVMLASTLLTALLTISTTAETRVLEELAEGGPLAGIKVTAAEPDPTQIGQDDARPGAPEDLDDAALDRIRGLPLVRDVVPVVSTRMYVVPSSDGPQRRHVDPFADDVVGVDMDAVPTLPISLVRGRFPTPGSLVEMAVTEGYLSRLGLTRDDADQVIGTEVQLAAPQAFSDGEGVQIRGRWIRVQIVGLVAQEVGDGQILMPAEQVELARQWTLAGIADSGDRDIPTSPYAGLFVVADGIDNVGPVRQEITTIGYSTSAPENLIASVRRYLHVVEIVLTSIGSIALIVAALGITNAMLAAVRERRREIGVLKAIGSRDRDVRRVFLVEAAALGFVGGVLGAVAGVAISRLVGDVVNGYLTEQGLQSIELELPVLTMGLTVFGATVLAVVAGTLPAVRAARLPARDAVGAV